jgi:hypothetical protein
MDTFLGLLGITVYILAMLSLSAGVTFLVIRLSPVNGRNKPKPTATEKT